jgi:hypothetical protein
VERKPSLLPQLPEGPLTKELAEQVVERVIVAALPQLTHGLVLSAVEFLKREEVLREAIQLGVALGERYSHEKPTVPAPHEDLRSRMYRAESGVLPNVQTVVPSVVGSPKLPPPPSGRTTKKLGE